jgi:pyruvate ferredoxin oxidoreductase beta subunit
MEAQPVPDQKALFTSGHRACHGCGMALGARHILEATGDRVIVVTPTGCLETFTSPYGYSPWGVPWIHHLFENGPAVASGVAAALKAQGRKDVRVIVLAGDGSTFDIGFGALSGMLERGDDVLYVCFENGAYMNTGGQRSGATPTYAATTTHPAGKHSQGKPQAKKDLPAIVAAHGTAYVATASIAHLKDLRRKVRDAMGYRGPRYIQVDTPCPSGWGFAPDQTLEIARLGVNCGLVPLFELQDGRLTRVRKIRHPRPVEDYLRAQGRFKHLFADAGGPDELERLRRIAEGNIARYGLAAPGAADGQPESETN